MPASHVIVWDLDNTLGCFEALELMGPEGKPGLLRVRLRPELAETLRELTRQGFVHTVLTLASPRYAQAALYVAGLRDCFTLVEGLGQRGKGDAEGIAATLGITPEERPHRMIFIGDHPLFDPPQDGRIVFHFEPYALTRPASQFARLVLHLRNQGQGSIRQGFESLLRQRNWRRWLPWRRHKIPPQQRNIKGLDPVLLVERPDDCPVIAFAKPPQPPATATEHEMDGMVLAGLLG